MCARWSAKIEFKIFVMRVMELLKILLKDIGLHVQESMKLHCDNY